MSVKRIAANLLIIGHQWHTIPLSCSRQISSSASLSARGIRGSLRRMNMSEDEAMDFTPEEFEELSNPNLDDFQGHASDIERDSSKFQYFIQQKTIRQKYFKKYESNEENFLIWAMKEQLKYLHATDPDEWTPEALAAAFPISAVGAQNLIKSKWIPENEDAIERHDRAVLARWRKYTNGQLGSVRLLEEILKNRLGQSAEKLPIPIMDQDKLMSTLESLQYENYENPRTTKKQSKKTQFPKAQKIKSGSFVSIIEDYEAQVSKPKDSDTTPRHVDASDIISGVPEYEGSYSKISSDGSHTHSKINKIKNNRKVMTLEEFMKSKSIS